MESVSDYCTSSLFGCITVKHVQRRVRIQRRVSVRTDYLYRVMARLLRGRKDHFLAVKVSMSLSCENLSGGVSCSVPPHVLALHSALSVLQCNLTS